MQSCIRELQPFSGHSTLNVAGLLICGCLHHIQTMRGVTRVFFVLVIRQLCHGHSADDFTAYTTAAKGTTNYNLKFFEMAKINSAANFNYVQALFGVADFSQFIKLSTDHAREQMATMTEQTKTLTALAQETVTLVSEPLKAEVSKAFNKA
jgi:Phasin protein